MGEKIETKILKGKINWIKEDGKPPKLEGEILMEFRCSKCGGYNQFRKDLANYDGTSSIDNCVFCDESYLVDINLRNPVSFEVGDSESVKLYKQMIPGLQKVRGIKPSDEINLNK